MLRMADNPTWNANYNKGYKNVNEIYYSGEKVGYNSPNGDGVSDPYTPVLTPDKESFTGSHYWFTQRCLYNGYKVDRSYEWISQVAYSYFTPSIAVRVKYGTQTSPENADKWFPWEFTIMSGLLTHTINYNGGTFIIQKHRNSRVCYVGLYNVYVNIESANSIITIGQLPTSFYPSMDMDYTVRIDTDNGEMIAIMNISRNGVVSFRSQYVGRIVPQSLVVFLNDIDL